MASPILFYKVHTGTKNLQFLYNYFHISVKHLQHLVELVLTKKTLSRSQLPTMTYRLQIGTNILQFLSD